MKVLRLKLVNFIGVMHGLGKDEIEIDFTKGNHKIVMFRGGNGSGKSSIVGQITPFKQSTDNRDQIILEGKDGRKEIDYEHKGHIYKITHLYPAKGTAQSFIEKDGVELNENGAVRAFEGIVEKEFGITKDYFNIGKIGSNTKNFVDFSTADRKKYIGTFIDINDYLDAFKVVNDKLKNLKKDVITVADELKHHEDPSVVNTRISQLSENIKSYEKSLEKALPEKGRLESKIHDLDDEINGVDLSELKAKKSENEKALRDCAAIKANLEKSIDINNIDSKKDELQKKISQLEGDIRVNESEKKTKCSLVTSYDNKIKGLNIQINGLGNPDDIVEINKKISKCSDDINNIKKELLANPEYKLVETMLAKNSDISQYLTKLSIFLADFEKMFVDLNKNSLDAVHTNIEFFLKDNCGESLQRQAKQSRETIEAKRTLESEYKATLAECNSHLNQLEVLKKRPVDCQINSCPFISEALRWKNVQQTINETEAMLAQAKKDLELLEVKADNLDETISQYEKFRNMLTTVDPRGNALFVRFCEKQGGLLNWSKVPFAEFQKSKEEFLANVRDAIDGMKSLAAKSNELENLTKTRDVYVDRDSVIRNKYMEDVKEFTKLKDIAEKDYSDLAEAGLKLLNSLNSEKELYGKYEEYINASAKAESAENILKTLDGEIDKLEKLTKDKADLEKEYGAINDTIKSTQDSKAASTTEYNNNLVMLSQINSLNDKLKNLKKAYEPTDAVAKALSPKSGIPLIFIKLYLDQTKKIANELLNIAYNGEFKIDFDLSDKDFKIKVIAKDNEKDDISLASQGEVALTTISLSLALIEQSIGEYNILCLDEIDGPLDAHNRENFINILNAQIDKLGIEQVFVISHNNAFDICPMDLVLLKDSAIDMTNDAFMEGKTVLYDYSA